MTTEPIVWKSVTEPFHIKYCENTLVKVRGWCRNGYGSYSHVKDKWTLRADPAFESEKHGVKVTHWLAVLK